MTGEVHPNRVRRQKSEIKLAKPMWPSRTVERGPTIIVGIRLNFWTEDALDDTGWLSGGVERCVGDEGEDYDGDLVEKEGFFWGF